MDYTVDPRLLATLRELEDIITKSERPSIHARWDSGRRILAFYEPGKKQLAKGLLDDIAQELGVKRSEVGDRLRGGTGLQQLPAMARLDSGAWWASDCLRGCGSGIAWVSQLLRWASVCQLASCY